MKYILIIDTLFNNILEKTGKNEYILTSDEVENYSPSEIKKTFTPPADQQDLYKV